MKKFLNLLIRHGSAVVLLCGAHLLFAADAQPDAAGIEFFEKKIRPLLMENCYKCHSHESEKVKGGLLLDTREGLLKGGDTGSAVIPGDPEKSLLIKSVRYTDENLQMPPKGKKLAAEQIADLKPGSKSVLRIHEPKKSSLPARRFPIRSECAITGHFSQSKNQSSHRSETSGGFRTQSTPSSWQNSKRKG